MRIHTISKLSAIALAAVLILATGKAAAGASGTDLKLAQTPLFGLNVKPNILLVLDDSTTMDLEVLFRKTRDGVLYWDPSIKLLAGDAVDYDRIWNDKENHFLNGFGPQYAFGYLFPNGNNAWNGAKSQRTSAMYKAIPPLPSMGFARSPSYNKLYFNPNITYHPWPGMSDASWTMADPAPGVDQPLKSQPAIQQPTDNNGSSSGGDEICEWWNIGCIVGNVVEDLVNGLVNTLTGLLTGNDSEDIIEPVNVKYAFQLTTTRGHFTPGELFTYANWMGQIPDGREYIGCTTGSLLLHLYKNEAVLDSVLSADTVQKVFGVLFGVLTNASGQLEGLLRNKLMEFLSNPLNALSAGGEFITTLLNLVLGFTTGAVNGVGDLLSGDGLDKTLHEVLGLVLGLLKVLDIPAPCLGFDWSTNGDSGPGSLLNLGDTVESLKNGVVGKITGHTGRIALQYYPATFYLYKTTKADEISLPDDYGYDVGDTLKTSAPDGRILVRYQIRPANFASQAKFKAAIQNFANWFVYYRKRHLAVRGALMQALSNFNGIRVGVTTTNERDTFNMYKLGSGDPDDDGKSAQQELFNAIAGLNFYKAAGTPNRKGLQWAGQQLENNPDIITKACQPNYAMLVTDGYNTAGLNDKVGNEDKNSAGFFSDGYSNTMADVAMAYYQDLDPARNFSSPAPVPTPSACNGTNPPLFLDCNPDPHMVTYGITLGQPGTIFHNPDSGNWPVDPYKTAVTWPNPNPDGGVDEYNPGEGLYALLDGLLGGVDGLLDIILFDAEAPDLPSGMGREQIDDLWHATVNSRGDMFLAETPRAMTNQFESMLRRILASKGSASSLAAGENLIFQPLFMGYDWSGELIAYNQSDDGSPDDIAWRASEHIPPPAERVILTYTTACSDNGEAVAFDTDSATLANCGLSDAEIRYLRGVAPKDIENSGDFRNRRGNVLGDIVHSDPVLVAAPNRTRYPSTWTDLLAADTIDISTMPENVAADYNSPDPAVTTDFVDTAGHRMPVVYVGANDGMLHGFNAETGAEVLAYIPGALLRDDDDADDVVELAELTKSDYSHEPYVDGSPAVGDVVFGKAWHTVLVGGLRGGGKAIYALDVTNPSEFSEENPKSIVLWEFTDDDLGYTYGEPSIVRLHNGEWAAIFGNGYNSYSTDDPEGDNKGGARLFIVDIETGAQIAEITAVAGDGATANGLAQPTPVDVDGDFIVDYVYAGDLQGNLWKFDLTSNEPDTWEDPQSVTKLIATEDDAYKPQPITSAPVVGVHPYGRSYGVMVYFGTGKLLEQADVSPNNPQHSFYGIWDPNVIGSTVDGKPATVDRYDDLVEQNIETPVDKNGNTYRVITDKKVAYSAASNSKRGWYIDLVGSGEIVINNPYIRRGVVGFTTALPSTNSCAPSGSGFIMRVSALNGGPAADVVFDANGDGTLSNNNDAIFTTTYTDTDGKSVTKTVGASGVQVKTGRPSEATFVPGMDQVLYNTTSGAIQGSPTPAREGVRRTWRVIRP